MVKEHSHTYGEQHVGLLDDNQHGKGTWTNGDKYVGDWLKDEIRVKEYYMGVEIIGDWLAGYQHGKGTFIWANEEKKIENMLWENKG